MRGAAYAPVGACAAWRAPRRRTAARLLLRLTLLCAALHRAAVAAALACLNAGATCDALGDLYGNTGGATWAARSGWSDAAAGRPTDFCRFTGVTCAPDGNVTSLSLSQNGLVGTLPASLGALRGLTALDLSSNVLRGPLPASLGSLTRLTSLSVSGNIIYGTLPDSFSSLTALQSLGLANNVFNGTLPAYLGLLPQLTALFLGTNYFSGAVPATLGSRAFSNLTLGPNLLNSTGFPPALCPFACAATGAPFLCPVEQPCSSPPGGAACSTQCTYPACPVNNLTVSTFAFAANKCAKALPQDACLVCLPAITSQFTLAPFYVTSTLPILSCLVYYTPHYLAAGADPSALALIQICNNLYGFALPSWQNSTCPVTLQPSAFGSLARTCASTAQTCNSCVDDIVRIFRGAGVVTSTSAGNAAQYDVLGTCIDLHLVAMVTAGADAATLSQIQLCPTFSGFTIVSTVTIGGISAASFSAGIFAIAVASVFNVRPSAVSVQNVTDAAVARRRLHASAVLVVYAISCASAAEQTTVASTLRLRIGLDAVMAQLRQGGMPATSLDLVSLQVTAGPPATPAVAAAAAMGSSSGRVVGAVVGSIGGAFVLAAVLAAFVASRRRTVRQQRDADAAASAAAAQLREQSARMLAGDTTSPSDVSSQQSLHDSMQNAGSTRSAAAGGSKAGWRAVASEASEVQLRECVGQGAAAAVHRATWRGSEVAVKVWDVPLEAFMLPGTPGNSDFSISGGSGGSGSGGSGGSAPADASFMREVQLLSSLRHPNILAIYGIVKSPPMMIMEYGAAGSLKDLLARTTLATLGWQRRMAIAASVASGVEFLHAQTPPIIHTDLKAGNIVLDASLTPKVADFGVSWLARTGLAAQTLTRGTPRYMAPEVARAEPITNSKAVDAYGMGMVLRDLAHVNTDGEATTRLAGATAPADDEVSRATWTWDTDAGASGGEARHWSSKHVLVARESVNYETTFAPHVPAALRELIRDALAVLPDARPSLPQLRLRLEALAAEAPAW